MEGVVRRGVVCVSVAAVMCMRDARDARSREMMASAAVRVAAPLGCARTRVLVLGCPGSLTPRVTRTVLVLGRLLLSVS